MGGLLLLLLLLLLSAGESCLVLQRLVMNDKRSTTKIPQKTDVLML